MNQLDKLVAKWKPILEAEGAPKIESKKVLRATALMLENEFRYIGGDRGTVTLDEATSWASGQMDPNGAGYVGNAEFHKIAIPMVRRTFPELVAHEIVGVQPLVGPVGIAFALRFKAGQTYAGGANQELGYNTIDPSYTGSMETSAGEQLGSHATDPSGLGTGLGIGTGSPIKEVNLTLEKAQVEAKTRKLRSRWSLEVAQDLKAMHGLDIETEMMDILAYEITAEIDRELMAKIRTVAAANGNSGTWDYTVDADGRWEAEKYRNMYNLLIRKANQIAIDTRRGPGNFSVADPLVCAAFEATSAFTIAPVNSDVKTVVAGVSKVGTMDGRIVLYRDTFANPGTDNGEFVVGFKGASEYDTGIVYLPYIQLQSARANFEDSFNPTMGLMSRYAIHEHIFGAKNYYVRMIISKINKKV